MEFDTLDKITISAYIVALMMPERYIKAGVAALCISSIAFCIKSAMLVLN